MEKKLQRTLKADFAFVRFDNANPQVYRELRRLARRAVARGRKRIGIKMLWEVMRWNLSIETTDDAVAGATFKLNNNYPSRYARLLMERESDLRGVFEIRELRP